MILQALKDYYDRKAADPDSDIAPYGFEWKEIPLIIVLDENGNPVGIEDTREGEGKKKRAKRFLVPQGVKKSVNISANLLWENPEYALGIAAPEGKKTSKKSREQQLLRVERVHAAFKEAVESFRDKCSTDEVAAVCKFLKMTDKLVRLSKFESEFAMVNDTGSNLSFKLSGNPVPVCSSPLTHEYYLKSLENCDDKLALCLISGTRDKLERLHALLKGVAGAQSSGANIVAFNQDAFSSFGKNQGANAPIGKQAAFAYATALNNLLAKDSFQRLLIGDTTIVFWAAKQDDAAMENFFAAVFTEPPNDDPDRGTNAVKSLYASINLGTYGADDSSRKFFVLGLAPNASRIAVRFWIADTVSAMADKIASHFRDLEVIHGDKEKEVLSLFRLLVSIAALGKTENIPPYLAGEFMRSILNGLPYPLTLLQAAVRRNRAEQNVTYARAALIKACINRAARYKNPNQKEELRVSLDLENNNVGYRLGRLFATLEKIQSESHPGINATIRDRYYGAASSTPVAVFSSLMKLKNHHLSKLESQGRRVQFEKLIGEIVDGLHGFPVHLNLEDQGRFAIGYYHQNREFYKSKDSKQTETPELQIPQEELKLS